MMMNCLFWYTYVIGTPVWLPGIGTSAMPARRSAAAVPAPMANTRRPRFPRSGASIAAQRTAFGLVNTTKGAASALRKAACVRASSFGAMRIVDIAMHARPAWAAARRTLPCCPTGRREITYHAAGCGFAVARMARSLWRAAPPRKPRLEDR